MLGVAGMNYSLLLQRSVDFDPFFEFLKASYPDELERQIWFGIAQMLWDRGETSGYVQHLTDRTYERTPPHQIIMDVAWGDHQVATVTADNIARTLKIPIYEPVLPEGVLKPLTPQGVAIPASDRTAAEIGETEPDFFYGLDPITKFPHAGSALFYWYSGTLAPPQGNITVEMGSGVDRPVCWQVRR